MGGPSRKVWWLTGTALTMSVSATLPHSGDRTGRREGAFQLIQVLRSNDIVSFPFSLNRFVRMEKKGRKGRGRGKKRDKLGWKI